MTMDVGKSETSKNGTTQQECRGCGKIIKERFLLKAMDNFWHEDCLKCNCCDCRLGEVGSTLYTKANLILCRRDYLRLFGSTGHCAACNKPIPAFEMVMRAKTNVYHLECFACQQCCHRFCVGDRFYLCDNKILCEYDFEERLVFANLTIQNSFTQAMKRQLSSAPTPPGPNVHPGQSPMQQPQQQPQQQHQQQQQQQQPPPPQQQQQQQQQHQSQQAQMLGQPMVSQHNHVANGQMPGSGPTVNGIGLGMGPSPRAGGPGDMNNNGLSGPGGMGPVKAPPLSMQAPSS